MLKYLEDISAFFSKWWVYLIYILIGIVGKFSWELSRNRRITFISAISTVGISGFIGYISSVYCQNNELEDRAAYIVPICTLLSDKIISYLVFRVKWKDIWDALVNVDKI